METRTEKRQFPRFARKALMNLFRMDDQDRHYSAQMQDHSKGGLSFISREKLIMDQFIYLEVMEDDPSASKLSESRSFSGSIKWISPMSSDEAPNAYKYGVAFL